MATDATTKTHLIDLSIELSSDIDHADRMRADIPRVDASVRQRYVDSYVATLRSAERTAAALLAQILSDLEAVRHEHR